VVAHFLSNEGHLPPGAGCAFLRRGKWDALMNGITQRSKQVHLMQLQK
jgi:hypothetical protein